jgi:hypothetical protein
MRWPRKPGQERLHQHYGLYQIPINATWNVVIPKAEAGSPNLAWYNQRGTAGRALLYSMFSVHITLHSKREGASGAKCLRIAGTSRATKLIWATLSVLYRSHRTSAAEIANYSGVWATIMFVLDSSTLTCSAGKSRRHRKL